MSQALINSVAIAVLGSVLAFVFGSFWHLKNNTIRRAEREAEASRSKADTLARDNKELENRVRDLETKFTAVNERITPITAAFQAMLIKELTHFHTPELDALLAKVGPPCSLSDGETERMAALLAARAEDMNGRISSLERDAATMLPMVIRRARAEAEALAVVDSELQIVQVPDALTPE